MTDPMIGGEPIAAGLTWFLDTFMTSAVDAAKKYAQRKKTEFDWVAAAEQYRASLIKDYGLIRVFGTSQDVELQAIFTDVYIFKEQLARIHNDIEMLHKKAEDDRRTFFGRRSDKPVNGMALIKQDRNLFVLGKPGAGKTTFMKYLTIQAAKRNLNRVPIFVSLNAWANSPSGKGDDPQLLPFIVSEFAICKFPEAEAFVTQLLTSGKALVLFDGLDEVLQEHDQRRQLVQLLKNFARQYDQAQQVITCRIAASDYAFERFDDVEVADFSEEQINEYAQLWFKTEHKSHDLFLAELAKPENAGVRELCNIPLLLSMICLYFSQRMAFPPNRAELYEDAIKILLSRWDASREIQRDEMPRGQIIYRELSPGRKEQLFAAIAYESFERGEYFFRRRDLAKRIGDYVATLPNVPPMDMINHDMVLRAIEAQHSIFVERAKDIYSFSHLTFQEYFAARYIFDNEKRGTTRQLIRQRLTDNRWREVFLLTASLYDSNGATDYFQEMQQAINHLVADEPALVQLLAWADARTVAATPRTEQYAAVRLAYIYFALDLALDLALALARTLEIDLARTHALDLDLDLDLARDLDLDLDLARDLARDLSVEVGIDYGLYYAWAIAAILAKQQLDRNVARIQTILQEYLTLFTGIINLSIQGNQSALTQQLGALPMPAPRATVQAWQHFADQLFAVMQQRGLVQEWQFTDEQIDKLNAWLAANELFVQCLKLAVVPDRQGMLNRLLAPPAKPVAYKMIKPKSPKRKR